MWGRTGELPQGSGLDTRKCVFPGFCLWAPSSSLFGYLVFNWVLEKFSLSSVPLAPMFPPLLPLEQTQILSSFICFCISQTGLLLFGVGTVNVPSSLTVLNFMACGMLILPLLM